MNWSLKTQNYSFFVNSFTGTEGLSECLNFTIQIQHQDFIETCIGQTAELVHDEFLRKGIIDYWQVEYIDVNRNWHYTCNIISKLEFYMRYNRYATYKELSLKQVIDKLLSHPDLTHNTLCRADSRYKYLLQHEQSNLDMLKYICSQNGIYFYEDHITGTIFLDNQNLIAPSKHQLKYTSIKHTGNMDIDLISEWSIQTKSSIKTRNISGFNYHMPEVPINYSADSSLTSSYGIHEEYSTYINNYESAKTLTINASESTSTYYITATRNYYLTAPAILGLTGNKQAGSYFLTKIKHNYRDGSYSNICSCIKVESKFIPEIIAPKNIGGIETATVKDYAENGQVIFQYHWDKTGEHQVSAPVLQGMAGNGYGTCYLPRIGQRVAVSFERGDPSRPFVSGSFYDGANLTHYPTQPPYKNYIRTESFNGSKHNEITLDDQPGQESILIYTSGRLTEKVSENKQILVENGSIQAEVRSGGCKFDLLSQKGPANYEINIITGDLSCAIDKGNSKLVIKEGNYDVEIGTGTASMHIVDGSLHIKVPKVYIIADSIEISSKQASLDSQDLSVKCVTANIQASDQVDIKSTTKLNLTAPFISLNDPSKITQS